MKKLVLIFALLSAFNVGVAQEIYSDILDDNCRCKPTLFDSIVGNFTSKDTTEIKSASVNARERLAFLNSDFETAAFSKACAVKCTDFLTQSGRHLGIINIGICNDDKMRCLRAIRQSQRSNFKIKVLTVFKVIEHQNELVIIYSETPKDGLVQLFLR
jgi:hypothetical protein